MLVGRIGDAGEAEIDAELATLSHAAGATGTTAAASRAPRCWIARPTLIEASRRRTAAPAGARGRQDAGRRGGRNARGGRFLPLVRRPGARAVRRTARAARPDRRAQHLGAGRPRRVRLHLAVEFPAGDLRRPGRGGARRRQRGRRQAGGANAADRRPCGGACCTAPACRTDVLALLPGDGSVGERLVARPAHRGRRLHRRNRDRPAHRPGAGATRAGPIVPFIAETGGINAMLVDSSALPEQVVTDVLTSAFGSAGQRCSALRLLCLQEEIADRVLTMLRGAAETLVIGDPLDPATDIGPVIDDAARDALERAAARRWARRCSRCRCGLAPSTAASSPRASCCWSSASDAAGRSLRPRAVRDPLRGGPAGCGVGRDRRHRLRPDARRAQPHRGDPAPHRASACGSATPMSTATRSARWWACSRSAAAACPAPARRPAARSRCIASPRSVSCRVNTTAAGGNAALLALDDE